LIRASISAEGEAFSFAFVPALLLFFMAVVAFFMVVVARPLTRLPPNPVKGGRRV
jgi:hypothetical protein